MRSITLRKAALLVSCLLVVGLLVATLRPLPGSPQPPPGLCLFCGQTGGADFLANVVAFVPLGVALALALRTPGRAVLPILAFSVFIEALQWRVVPGRDASVGDLVANATGGIAGALVAGHLWRLLRPDSARARPLIVGWSIVWSGIILASLWMLTPSTVKYRYWSYWAAGQRGHERFEGRVLDVSLFGTEVPHHARVEPDSMPVGYRRGEVELRLSVVGPYPSESYAEVYRLANPLGQRANIAVRRDQLVFRPPLNAATWRFWSPTVRFDGAVEWEKWRETTDLQVRAGRGIVTLESTTPRGARKASATLHAADAWKFVVSDVSVPDAGRLLLTAAWFLAVFAPLGFWARTNGNFALGMTAAGLVAGIAFLVGPAIFRLAAAPLLTWMGVLLATLAGLAAGQAMLARRSEPRAAAPDYPPQTRDR